MSGRDSSVQKNCTGCLLECLPEYLRPLVRVAYITGWRKTELLTRRWEHVEEGWLRINAGETKNGEGRQFPLTTELRELLETQRALAPDCPWVFHRRGHRILSFKDSWRAATKAAGVPGLLFHDLRRSAVRNMERAGVPRPTAKLFTGHKTDSVYQRYTIVDDVMLREGAAKLEVFLKTS